MLTTAEKTVLEKWRTVRATATKSLGELDAHPLQPGHNMPELVVQCDAAIAVLEAKAALP